MFDSVEAKNMYIAEKLRILSDFLITPRPEEKRHFMSLPTMRAIDMYARKLIAAQLNAM